MNLIRPIAWLLVAVSVQLALTASALILEWPAEIAISAIIFSSVVLLLFIARKAAT